MQVVIVPFFGKGLMALPVLEAVLVAAAAVFDLCYTVNLKNPLTVHGDCDNFDYKKWNIVD
jgi:hypothetical protein